MGKQMLVRLRNFIKNRTALDELCTCSQDFRLVIHIPAAHYPQKWNLFLGGVRDPA